MVIPKIYIDTSVLGGYFDPEFEFYSKSLVQEFKHRQKIALISETLIAELNQAPAEVKQLFIKLRDYPHELLKDNNEIEILAEKYLKKKILPAKSTSDARHIATASYYKADVLVSWNFKHIVNYRRIHLVNAVNLEQGYAMIDIRSPREVIDHD